jgi:hypothetical protein
MLSWEIYRQLLRDVKRGKIEPVKPSFFQDGTLDPRRTTIRTSDLVKLAKRRRERPEYLAEFFDADKPPREGPIMASGARQEPRDDRRRAQQPEARDEPGDMSRVKSGNTPRAKKTHSRPAGGPAKLALRKLFGDKLPNKEELPNVLLCKRVCDKLPKGITASYHTIMREAGRYPRKRRY